MVKSITALKSAMMLLSLAFFLPLPLLLRQLRAQNPVYVLLCGLKGQHLLPERLVPLIFRLLLGKQLCVLVGKLSNLRDRLAAQRVKCFLRSLMLRDFDAVLLQKLLLVPRLLVGGVDLARLGIVVAVLSCREIDGLR